MSEDEPLFPRGWKWILNGKIPLPCEDLHEWALFMEDPQKSLVAVTDLNDELRVSTVFLGLDHRFSMSGGAPPILFETIVFGQESTHHHFNGREMNVREILKQRRYATWAEAEEGHRQLCQEFQRQLDAALSTAQAHLPKGAHHDE